MWPEIRLGNIVIPTFFVVISITLTLLIIYLSYRTDRDHKNRQQAFDLALILMLASFVGGRLFHVFYEEWPFYEKHPLNIFYFWQGGFVFYGGFILALISAATYTHLKKISFFEWADFFAPLLALAHAFGRIGCLLAGCCYGIKCDLPWAIAGRHPTPLYLFLGESLIYFFLLYYEKQTQRKWPNTHGLVFIKWVLLHSILRFYTEYFRDDFRGSSLHLGSLGLWSISQVISFILIIFSCAFFIWKSAVYSQFYNHRAKEN